MTSAIDAHQVAALIKRKGKELGFDLVGITSAEKSRHEAFYNDWLAAGNAGEMHYLHDRTDERLDPAVYFPLARTAICVGLNYHVKLPEESPSQPAGRFARYALGKDYHVHIKDRLHDLADYMREIVPGTKTRSGVDTVPVLERELASRAGVGWVGKNTLVINERFGSWIFLGEILTNIELPFDSPGVDRCGTCTRCIDACPTQAITPYKLNASRCISYLTIEHKSEIAPELADKVGDWIFGCDICQDVCPWNRKAPISLLEDVQPVRNAKVATSEILNWSQDEYWAATRRSSTRRVKLPQFQRNARVVEANAARASAT